MNVLQVCTWDSVGGAARVAHGLHLEYARRGMGSDMYARYVTERDPHIQSINGQGLLRAFEGYASRVEKWAAMDSSVYPSTRLMPLRASFKEADVLHLHNLHGAYFNIRALRQLSALKPTVWTLHDMWAITGHCAHSFECERWLAGCGRCPHLDTPPVLARDRTDRLWRTKQRAYSRSELSVVCPSVWLAEKVRKSPLLRDSHLEVIPNGVDVDVFRVFEKDLLRSVHGIPVGRPVIVLTVPLPQADYKGGGHLCDLLESPEFAALHPVVLALGERGCLQGLDDRVRVVELGWVRDDALLAQYLAAADAYVMTSLAENAPLTVLESMACGTAVVAFDVGGVAELVPAADMALLVPAGDTPSLLDALAGLVSEPAAARAVGARGRLQVEAHFTLDAQADAYLSLYARIAKERAP